ncbi:MAG: cache domain-containing protein [Acidiferrobacterales bacterium]|nr:cache domain-containing protein [Acidiferrobacterales bacterium]
MRTTLTIAFLLLAAAVSASADLKRGTAAEAKDMVARAIAYYDQVGSDRAFEKFTDNPAPEFFDRDLYVFVIRIGGPIVAHAANSSFVGVDIRQFVDIDSNEFGKKMLSTASPTGTWINYKSITLTDGAPRKKASWLVLHDNHLFGVGIYID